MATAAYIVPAPVLRRFNTTNRRTSARMQIGLGKENARRSLVQFIWHSTLSALSSSSSSLSVAAAITERRNGARAAGSCDKTTPARTIQAHHNRCPSTGEESAGKKSENQIELSDEVTISSVQLMTSAPANVPSGICLLQSSYL